MVYRLLELAGSKRFTLVVLKSGVAVPVVLAILWVAGLKPPAFYMVWVPLALWGVLFCVNLMASLITRPYSVGSMLFHISFVVVVTGIVVSLIYRFDGEAVVPEEGLFMGEQSDYLRHNAEEMFDELAPHSVGFYIERIEPQFWQHRLYFTGLRAYVKYPPDSLKHRTTIELNGGATIGGARLRLTGYGIFPEIAIEKAANTLFSGVLRVNLFPPGRKESISLGSYQIEMSLYPDHYLDKEGRPATKSMYIRDAVLHIKVVWLTGTLYEGSLRMGESVGFADMVFTFRGLRRFVTVGVVKDPGERIVFAGFVVAGVGILSMVYRAYRRRG